jgi:hypothetical protein
MNKPPVLSASRGFAKGRLYPDQPRIHDRTLAAADVAAGLKGQIHIDANDAGWVVTLGKSVLSIDGGGVPPAYPGRG